MKPRKWKVQIIDVEMNDVELCGMLTNEFQHQNMMRQRIDAAMIQTQPGLAYRYEACGCLRIAAGKQGDVVPHPDEFFSQERNHALCAAIEAWRNAFVKWGHLRDMHDRGSLPQFGNAP